MLYMPEDFTYEKERHLYHLLKSSPIFWTWRSEQLKCQSNKCAWCENPLTSATTEVDHIKPIFHGGISTAENMVLSCHDCNKEKSIRTGFLRPSWIAPNKFADDMDKSYNQIRQNNQNSATLFDLSMYARPVIDELPREFDRLFVAKDNECSADIRLVRLLANEKCSIRFKNGKEYTYYSDDIKLEPITEIIEDECLIEVDNEPKTNVNTILRTENRSKIIYNSGYAETFLNSSVEVVGSCLDLPNNRAKFNYLKRVVNEIEDLGLKNDNDENILQKYFNEITYIRDDVVLDNYLRGHAVSGHGIYHHEIIYPFGFNESQRKATENALNNKVSIIEGPPGTGKTNTILNIIANLVVNNKTVAVVSNNNSATDNIYEKLVENNFDAIVARLGKRDNKIAFIDSQKELDPSELSRHRVTDSEERRIVHELNALIDDINEGYRHQNNVAIKSQELEELKTERRHFIKTVGRAKLQENCFRRMPSSENVLKYWHEIEEKLKLQKPISFLQKIRYWFLGGFRWSFLRLPLQNILISLKYQYYSAKSQELEESIRTSRHYLAANNISQKITTYTKGSKQLFRAYIAEKYLKSPRRIFQEQDLWRKSKEFIEDYPVVLSTTYSLRKSLNPNFVYDYIIIDESSQVDLATFVLAISCARKLVLVGDEKQLPNVVKEQTKKQDATIFQDFDISEAYCFSTNSALSSARKIFGPAAPSQLLREHYRCHPDIIGFCNKRFYNDELIILTPHDANNKKPLGVYYTVAGNHERDHINQRQIDVTLNEIVPQEDLNLYDGSVGIIAPYRNHTFRLREELKNLGATQTQASTVDAFQGRERDTIIINTVDNQISDFASDSNRLNVAVSRAKKHLYIVVNGNNNTTNTGIDELINYIKYNDGVQVESKIISIFDNLYTAYYNHLAKHHISEYPSENLMCDLLIEVLDEYDDLDFEFQYPLSLLCDLSALSGRKLEYASNELTRVDFVIYRRASRTPILAIEVDGWAFHNDSKQKERDANKNQILADAGLPLLRLATNGSNEGARLRAMLNKILQ